MARIERQIARISFVNLEIRERLLTFFLFFFSFLGVNRCGTSGLKERDEVESKNRRFSGKFITSCSSIILRSAYVSANNSFANILLLRKMAADDTAVQSVLRTKRTRAENTKRI